MFWRALLLDVVVEVLRFVVKRFGKSDGSDSGPFKA